MGETSLDIDHSGAVGCPRMSYRQGDVLDYCLMQGFTLAMIAAIYPRAATLGAAMVAGFMVLRFFWRFGLPRRAPRLQLIVQIAQSLQLRGANIPRALVITWVKHLLLSTVEGPATPLDVDGAWLFWTSFWLITSVRLVFFGHHVWHRRFVDSYLRRTTWKATLDQTNIGVELFHALCTGVMTHLSLVAPWYFLIANRRVYAALFPLHVLIDRYVDRSFYGTACLLL